MGSWGGRSGYTISRHQCKVKTLGLCSKIIKNFKVVAAETTVGASEYGGVMCAKSWALLGHVSPPTLVARAGAGRARCGTRAPDWFRAQPLPALEPSIVRVSGRDWFSQAGLLSVITHQGCRSGEPQRGRLHRIRSPGSLEPRCRQGRLLHGREGASVPRLQLWRSVGRVCCSLVCGCITPTSAFHCARRPPSAHLCVRVSTVHATSVLLA